MWWSWLLATIGVAGIYFVGRKDKWGWFVLLFNECLWITYAVITKQYGFIASAIAYAAVYIRSYIHWSKEPINKINIEGGKMTKKKVKLPLKFWKNPIRYVRFHRALKKVTKAL